MLGIGINKTKVLSVVTNKVSPLDMLNIASAENQKAKAILKQ